MRAPFQSRLAARLRAEAAVRAKGGDGVGDWLARVDALSRHARTMWLSLLAYLAFMVLTLFSVRDVDFFSLERAIDLPLVGVAIPTEIFFLAAPLLGAALHVYLHLHLLKLWDALADLPATVAGQPVGEAVFPWLISDWALRRRPDRDAATAVRPMAWLADGTVFLLVWAAAPLAFAGFWWRSMPAHEEALTLAIAVPLLLSLYAGRKSLRRARRRLGAPGVAYVPEPNRKRWAQRAGFATLGLALAAVSWARTEGGLDHAANRLIDAWETAFGEIFTFMVETPDGLITLEEARRRGIDGRTIQVYGVEPQDAQARWVAARLPTLRDVSLLREDGSVFWSPLASLDLRDADLARQQADWLNHDTARTAFRDLWCAARGLSPVACHGPQEEDFVGNGLTHRTALDAARTAHFAARRAWCAAQGGALDGDPICADVMAALERRFEAEWAERRTGYLAALSKPDMRGRDLRGADASGAFLAGLDFSGARLDGAKFYGARMEGAVLRGVQAADALFLAARLEGADFRKARAPRANFNQTWLDGADFRWARLEDASFYDARLRRAALSYAHMADAMLNAARLDGGDLYQARLQRATLQRARLQGARLVDAYLDGATLAVADLQGAALDGARLAGADLFRADLTGANLRDAHLNGAALRQARLENAILDGALLDFAQVHGADFSAARGLTQDQLRTVIGGGDAILPPGLHVWSCWAAPTPGLDRLLALGGHTRDSARAEGWLCAPDEEPRPVGRAAGVP